MHGASSLDAARRRLIVALDVPDAAAAMTAARLLAGHVGMLKVGLELFVAEGPEVVRQLRRALPDLEIFLDLKLHDIPNTMVGAIRSARALGARFITVHAGSGVAHLRACVDAAGPALGVLAVTVLTSLDRGDLDDLGFSCDVDALVLSRARRAFEAGCDGVVSSGLEAQKLRADVDRRLLVVTPGIRPVDNRPVDDQNRVVTPTQAFEWGADYIVVGRPIRQAANPRQAALGIQQTIREVFSLPRG